MQNRRLSIKDVTLTDTYWHDRNGRLRLGINAKLSFPRKTNSECIWGMDRAFVSKPDTQELLQTGFPIPDSLFNIEQVGCTHDEIYAVLTLNIEAYERQGNYIKRTIEKVWNNEMDLFLKVRLDEDLGRKIRVRLRPLCCCQEKEEK